MNLKKQREQYKLSEYVKSGLGADSIKRRTEFVLPGIEVDVQYPPKHIFEQGVDVTIIRLEEAFDEANHGVYEDYDEFKESLEQFVWGEFDYGDTFTNITYPRKVISEQVKQIIQ